MSQEMNDNCCPLCFSRTSFFDINLNLRLLICENLECSYPFDKDIEGFFSEINNDDSSPQLTTTTNGNDNDNNNNNNNNDNQNNGSGLDNAADSPASASTTPIMTSNEIASLLTTAQILELNNLLLLNDPTAANTNILQDFSDFAEFAELFKEFPESLASISGETVSGEVADQSQDLGFFIFQ